MSLVSCPVQNRRLIGSLKVTARYVSVEHKEQEMALKAW